jgi:hypothetical protein
MFRASIAFTLFFALPATGFAQVAQFRWTAGQVLVYSVGQATTATETVDGKSMETATKLGLVKRWQVKSVENGIATLEMSLDRLRMETKTPAGETLFFDSADPAKSTPALKDEMNKYVGVPLTVIRIDGRGQLVEVKQSKFGPASRLEADLPFKVVLPTEALAAGKTWERSYKIKTDAAQGETGAYEAVQKVTCKSLAGSTAVLRLSTEVKTLPGSAADTVPLLPFQPEGEVTFDLAAGRLRSVKFTIQKELDGHNGENSSYRYASTYQEELQSK